MHKGLGFGGQESNTISTQTSFVKEREIRKRAFIAMEEKEVGKECVACHSNMHIEAWKKVTKGWIILPPKSAPTPGGPRNQASRHHHKLKRYVMVYLVCLCCKKIGYISRNHWKSKG